ncbi:MAG: YbdD/YjiX family protein [Nitrosomonas sp.]|nr:MAG: YbdD/YjiX family protein [Nitrosomonas sp.]HMV13499.1 YbdD/YjiX family protein [Nitrosomonas sp.]HMW21432.1 YbdD/YjiX family protein [Nitrosomonas sp.]HMY62106.1 YbdD/YjiX family protein [Nitrosomonas sp.]HNB00925.1 YbdD/YjiX family protein [Nitrosomonas sp.]
MQFSITEVCNRVAQSLRLMVGVPEYSQYVAHMKTAHPDRTIMTEVQFYRERQEARYGGKVSRCC